ncbi:MAG: hypothetical protein GY707_09265 [Desulfobacteraceae bacterium]|nr:hypothetical protein [Desulfobacteraceae bacterium]
MEPFAIELGKTAMELAYNAAVGYNKKAHENKDKLLVATKYYLEAALSAMQGLESEYQHILTQAAYCRISNDEQVQLLKERIRNYLMVHKLIQEMETATVELEECEKRLKKETNGWFLKEKTQEERGAAINSLGKLLKKLNIYLRELEGSGLSCRVAGTGVGIKWLHEIKNHLEAGTEANQQSLRSLVEEAEKDSTWDDLKKYTRRIRTIIHEIQDAFG